ncbi:MAG: nucleoside hydrolase [Planctomycetota bacterium]|jgi:inosine-uridine nucleoside N-ribohydrolase
MAPRLLSDAERLSLLAPPEGRVRMVLDTDTYNEIDDQFAVVYALLSPEELEVEAIHAAPFHNSRSSGPADGMEKSYEEIVRLLDLLDGRDGAEPRDRDGFVFRGSAGYLPSRDQPVESAAARDLVERARAERDGPLYVVAIGAPTNVSSAILMDPEITRRIVVVWLGGNPHDWRPAGDFNMTHDVPASQVLFDSGVPLVQITCVNVAEMLRTTLPEIERWVKGRGRIGDYLHEVFRDYCGVRGGQPGGSKVIWDISAIAWLINADWVRTDIVHAPVLTDGNTYSRDDSRHLMREARHVDRDAVFGDLFRKLE